ncbi:hypothetical protein OIU74_020302 [Salix koriyanagi]|uniref:Uncharacterized protein n=1 Tax=Salix koriyanagi TaxID=2511006 RepID=A0A9Q0P5U9_9ROSI|nr:hypothetical protein OIU74_020302 [Salix koriyanagi]
MRPRRESHSLSKWSELGCAQSYRFLSIGFRSTIHGSTFGTSVACTYILLKCEERIGFGPHKRTKLGLREAGGVQRLNGYSSDFVS